MISDFGFRISGFPPMLASAETVAAWGGLAISSLLSIALFYVNAKAQKVDTLESNLNQKAECLVEAKVELAIARLEKAWATQNATVKAMLDSMMVRLERGDGHFDKLDDQRQKLELRTQQLISDLKSWVMENAASKDDLVRLEEKMEAFRESKC